MQQENSLRKFRRRRRRIRRLVKLAKRITAVVILVAAVSVFHSRQSDSVKAEAPVIPMETDSQIVFCIAEAQECTRDVSYVYPVPLDEETQFSIIRVCEAYHIDSAIVMAMIARESSFRADAIGDNGEAFGLLQVQPKWHQERMTELGCTDLLEPEQNVKVAVDYLAELIARGNGLEWALRAYNAGATGAKNGLGCDYAAEVLANSEKLKAGVEIGNL